MNYLIIHNKYKMQGGEESVVQMQKNLLESNGNTVIIYQRDYKEIKSWFWGKVISTFTSIYNHRSIKDIRKILDIHKIDIALIHNLYPIISPSFLKILHENNVKIMQVVHNYRYLCPTGLFFNRGRICEKCLQRGREWNCFIENCNNSKFGSFAYALKFNIIRKLNYTKWIDKFLCLSKFQINKLAQNGFDNQKLALLPNTYSPIVDYNITDVDWDKKKCIGFVGRLNQEKGFFDFVEIARQLPQYKFIVAGQKTEQVQQLKIPDNLCFEGFLSKEKMSEFYQKCKLILFISTWYEGFPMVILESYYYCTPLIVNRLSVMKEVVKDKQSGYVLDMIEGNNDIEKIKNSIISLFANEDYYKRMAKNARLEFDNEYCNQAYYKKLINIIK